MEWCGWLFLGLLAWFAVYDLWKGASDGACWNLNPETNNHISWLVYVVFCVPIGAGK
ncbi:MAG: hypothetical protein UX62_C0062G0001, partial [Microgenomates group bacterium GW2011_GWA2_46_7]